MDRSSFKLYATASVWGIVIGAALTTWLAPSGIAWYFDPPVDMGVSCREATEWAMARFRNAQFFGVLGGGILGIAVLAFFRKRSSSGAPPAA